MLTCIDPTEVRPYELDGATFMLGVLPKDVYAKVMAGARKAGVSYNELWLAVKYGVKGHDGISAKRIDGTVVPVPYETEIDASKREVTSEKTMAYYHAAGVISELSTEALTPGKGVELRAQIAAVIAAAKAVPAAEGEAEAAS